MPTDQAIYISEYNYLFSVSTPSSEITYMLEMTVSSYETLIVKLTSSSEASKTETMCSSEINASALSKQNKLIILDC